MLPIPLPTPTPAADEMPDTPPEESIGVEVEGETDTPAPAAPTAPVAADRSITEQAKTLGKRIAQTALSRLGNAAKLPTEVIALMDRIGEELAFCQIAAIGADADTLESLRWRMDVSFQALENLKTAEAMLVRSALLSAAQEIMPIAIQGALTIAATVLAGPAGGAIVGTIFEATKPKP